MKKIGIHAVLFFAVFGFSNSVLAAPIVADSFSTTWQTDNNGSSNSDQISFYLGTGGDEVCNGSLYWEELGNASNNGTSTLNSSCNLETITFPSDGSYRVDISGDFPTFRFSENGDAQKILTVEQWGDNQWRTLSYAFFNALNLTVPAVDAPDLSLATNISGMFNGASSFNQSINHWDVSTITTLNKIFYNAASFNQSLNNWDVSNVVDMRGAFGNAQAFNQSLDNWNVSNVTLMSDGNKGRAIFGGATVFNQPLNSWDVSGVTDLSYLFQDARAFNQPLDNWDVSNATTLAFMFKAAENFNQSLNNWDVTNVTSIESMFAGARVFNQPLDSWNVANVTTMGAMFSGALDFNQSINAWNVSNLTTTAYMFYFAADFNQSLNNWNTTNLQIADYMFYFASSYNQSLYSWNVQNVTNMYRMFTGTALNSGNYSNMLVSWAAQPSLRSDVYLDTDAQYCSTAQAARDSFADTYSWIISDGGSSPCLSLAYSAGSNASLVGLANQNVVAGENGTSVEVIPNTNYKFVSWSDGRTDNPRIDTNILIDQSVSAILVYEEQSQGTSGTRVGDRIKSYFYSSTTSSTPAVVTKESFLQAVRNLIEYLTKNEADLEKLTPAESAKIIVGLRDILVFLLTLLPGV